MSFVNTFSSKLEGILSKCPPHLICLSIEEDYIKKLSNENLGGQKRFCRDLLDKVDFYGFTLIYIAKICPRILLRK